MSGLLVCHSFPAAFAASLISLFLFLAAFSAFVPSPLSLEQSACGPVAASPSGLWPRYLFRWSDKKKGGWEGERSVQNVRGQIKLLLDTIARTHFYLQI